MKCEESHEYLYEYQPTPKSNYEELYKTELKTKEIISNHLKAILEQNKERDS